jgi:hypothetical protein
VSATADTSGAAAAGGGVQAGRGGAARSLKRTAEIVPVAAAAGQPQRTMPGAVVPVNAAATAAGPVGCALDLPDLLAIVLDLMNDKQAADKR